MKMKQEFDHLMAFAKDLINENLGFYYDINYGYFQPETHPIIDFIRLIGRRIQSQLMLMPALYGRSISWSGCSRTTSSLMNGPRLRSTDGASTS